MKKTSYMKRAAKRFLEGTSCRIPVEAVEAGIKSLTEWADILNDERERQEFEETRKRDLLEERRRTRMPNVKAPSGKFYNSIQL